MFGKKGAKKNGGSRCCNQFTSWTLGVFEIGLCILIIGTVVWHLTDYDVTVDLSYQCLLGTDPDSNGLCIYSYVVAGVGMFLSLVLMVAACALTEKWARAAHHLGWSLALVGILWYVVAAIIVSQKVKTANDDNDYNTKWRNGVAVTMWVLAILFAVRLLVGIILASCDCCGRKRAKKDALKDKAQGAEGDKSKQDSKEADKSKKMAEKDVEAGTPSDAKVQSDTVQAPDQAPVIPTVDTDGANVAAAAAVGAATGAAVVAVPTAVALAARGGDADKKAENGVSGEGVTAGLTGSAQTMPPVVPAAVSSMRRTVENSSQSMAAVVDTAKV